MCGIAWFYVKFSNIPALSNVLYGLKPVVVAIVLQAIIGLLRTAVKTRFLAALGIAVGIIGITGISIPILLISAGLFSAFINRAISRRAGLGFSAILALISSLPLASREVFASQVVVEKVPVTLTRIFLFFFKTGALQFGSGYVLLAFLRSDLVERWHWLTEAQLLDSIAVGQFTPGPVFTTATFIGYLLKGFPGAVVATIAIFLPAFVLVAVSGSLIPHLRKSPFIAAFLDGVIVASLALMGLVTWQLAGSSLVDITTVLIAAVSIFCLLRFQPNSAWLIFFGGTVGYVKSILF